MKFAILADIHGNVTALEAVLADCGKRGVDQFILLGDLFTKGSRPREVYECIRDLDIELSILGNTEMWLFHTMKKSREKEMAAFTLSELNAEALNYCNSLEKINLRSWGSNLVTFVHDSCDTMIHEEKNKQELSANIIISGHTHLPLNTEIKQKSYFNPGSVGMPYDGINTASYGILTVDCNVDFNIVRVPYDWRKEKEIAKRKCIPFCEEYCNIIEHGLKAMYKDRGDITY